MYRLTRRVDALERLQVKSRDSPLIIIINEPDPVKRECLIAAALARPNPDGSISLIEIVYEGVPPQ